MNKDKKAFLKAYEGIRKKMPPVEKVIKPKDRYERDKNWRWDREVDEGDDYISYNGSEEGGSK